MAKSEWTAERKLDLVLGLVGCAMIVPVMAGRAWAVMLLWQWHVARLVGSTITVWQALGLSVLVHLLINPSVNIGARNDNDKSESRGTTLLGTMVGHTIAIGFFLALGWFAWDGVSPYDWNIGITP